MNGEHGRPDKKGREEATEMQLEVDFIYRCCAVVNNRYGTYLGRFVSRNGFLDSPPSIRGVPPRRMI